MRLTFAIVALLGTVACSQNPAGPSPAAERTTNMDYTINVPDPILAQQLITQHPKGITMAPITAQLTFDYRAGYGGSANAYYGPLGGDPKEYVNAGILIAPTAVAREDSFLGAEWGGLGLEPATRYVWVGIFQYTAARATAPVSQVPIFVPTPPANR